MTCRSHVSNLSQATKRLLQQITDTAPDGNPRLSFLASPLINNGDWNTWIVHESIRRTLFLLYTVHELLHVAETLDHAYFEPLFSKGEEGIYESIALPSTEDAWLAESEDDWHHVMHLQQQQQQKSLSSQVYKLGTTERRVSGGDEAWMLAEFPRLPELMRLILSVGPLYGAVRQCTSA